MDLTLQDIEALLESMEAWERDEISATMFSGLVGGMLTAGSNKEMREQMQRDREAEMKEARQKAVIRKERSVVIRAKLIALRNSMSADKILADAQAS